MTYDFHGTWENITNHQSSIYSTAHNYIFNTDKAVSTLLLDYNVEPYKINIGCPMYGRVWKNVNVNKNNGFL